MSSRTVIQCDGPGCKNQMQTANHWFQFIYKRDGSVVVVPGEVQWCLDADTVREQKDICGQECGAKELQAFMRGERS